MKHLLTAALLSLAAAPLGAAPASPARAASQLSFAVVRDLLIEARPATLLDLFQDPQTWSGQVGRDHIGGPLQGVGADYKVVTKPEGGTMTRRELTIVADDKRVVLRILNDPPYAGTTFVEFSVAPEGKATRATFKIYCDLSAPGEISASMVPAVVKQNEAILAGHLQRIKAAAEKR